MSSLERWLTAKQWKNSKHQGLEWKRQVIHCQIPFAHLLSAAQDVSSESFITMTQTLLLNKKSQIPPYLHSRSSSFAFILHDVTHCRDLVTHQLLLSSMWSMLPERNHYGCVTRRCNSLWMSWILTGFLQTECIPCNYNPRFPPAFTAQAALTKVHKNMKLAWALGPSAKQKPLNYINHQVNQQPITCGGNLG